MIELSLMTVMVAGELAVGLLLLTGGLLFFYLRQRATDKKAAKALIASIKEGHESRRQERQKIFEEQYGLESEKLGATLADFNAAEMKLYQTVIQGYLKRDVELFIASKSRVDDLVELYQGLTPSASPDVELDVLDDGESQSEGEVDLAEKLETLKEENARLLEELRGTMDTMGRMLNEYSGLFTPEGEGKVSEEKISEMVAEDDTSKSEAVSEADDSSSHKVEATSESSESVEAAPVDADVAVEGLDAANESTLAEDDAVTPEAASQ